MFALVRFVFLFLLLVVAGGVVLYSASARRKKRESFSSKSVLWDLIVKCDDICFTHILPRLNRTDLKFLYGGEYGDEKVGEEIISAEGFEKEV